MRSKASAASSIPASSGPSELAERNVQIAAWSRGLAADPASAIALAQLSGLHLQRARETGDDADFVRAEEYARRSLALRTERNAKTYVTLTSALLAQHRFSEAVAEAAKAVEYDPETPQYQALLGEALLELGDYSAARAAFSTVYRFRTHLSIAPRLSRWEELNGRPVEARRILRNAVAAAESRRDIPREQLAWFYLRAGDLDMRYGRFRGAREYFLKGLKVEPGDYRLLSALARLEYLSGDNDEAIRLGERATSIKLDPATLGILGDAWLAEGDREKAEENIRAMAVSVSAQVGAFHRDWSLFLLDHDRDIPAVFAAATQELRGRKDIYGYDLMAWSQYKLGRFAEAESTMRKAMQLGTRDPMLLYHAGMISIANRHLPEGERLLDAALDLNPRFDPVQAKIARSALDSVRKTLRSSRDG